MYVLMSREDAVIVRHSNAIGEDTLQLAQSQ